MSKENLKTQAAIAEDSPMLLVTSTPHIRSNESTQRIMLDVIIALTPAILGSIYFFGLSSLKLILISIASSVLFEGLIQKLFKKEVTVYDLSAVVTGILLAFNLPASAPWWLPIFGSAFAIIIVKQFFGGLGSNFMNPALAGRAFLLASWPTHMSTFTGVRPDVVAQATPLAMMKYGTDSAASATVSAGQQMASTMDMFLGKIPGAIGETSVLLLLIGVLYLIYRQVIDWKIPVAYIATTALMLFVLKVDPEMIPKHLFAGGLMLGACFMITDYATTPITTKGRIIFAVGAGILTAIIRIHGSYPEGVSYSILFMNLLSPMINRFTKPKVFGEVK